MKPDFTTIRGKDLVPGMIIVDQMMLERTFIMYMVISVWASIVTYAEVSPWHTGVFSVDCRAAQAFISGKNVHTIMPRVESV